MSIDISAIEQRLWPYGSTRDIWMVVDTARERGIYADIMNSYFTYSCLYSGTLAYELESAAPHLVQLEFEDKYTRALIEKSWGKSWGVFLKCDLRLEKVRRHLRTFLLVKNWKGQQMLFRYYDPRVLRVYLPTCVSEELKTVFGPVKRFWTENESADRLIEFEFSQGKLKQEEIAVASAGSTLHR